MDKVERILGQVNNIMTQANNLRNNPLIKQAAPAGITAQQTTAGLPSASTTQGAEPPNYAVASAQAEAAAQKPLKLNENAARGLLADLISEVETAQEPMKTIILNMSVQEFISAYRLQAGRKKQLEDKTITLLSKWLPELVK